MLYSLIQIIHVKKERRGENERREEGNGKKKMKVFLAP
jgi:hypothetical protein